MRSVQNEMVPLQSSGQPCSRVTLCVLAQGHEETCDLDQMLGKTAELLQIEEWHFQGELVEAKNGFHPPCSLPKRAGGRNPSAPGVPKSQASSPSSHTGISRYGLLKLGP